MCLAGFCWIRLVIAPSFPARCFFGNLLSVTESTNSFYFYFNILTPTFPFFVLVRALSFKGSQKRGASVKKDSFTKSPRGNKGFDLQEPFGVRQFRKTTKEKVLVYDAFDLRELLARDSFAKPQKEKVFGLWEHEQPRTLPHTRTPLPHTRYNEQWKIKINICRVGVFCSSRFTPQLLSLNIFLFLWLCVRGVEKAFVWKFWVPFILLRRKVLVSFSG